MQTLPRRFLLICSIACSCFTLLTHSGLSQENPAGVSGYDYRRPTLQSGARLVFIGDSITDMKWGRQEEDRNHYLGHSFVFLIASRLHADLPQLKLEFFNRGKSGNTVGDLKQRWKTDAIELKPDILSILVGVNDIGRACRANKKVNLKQWEADYRSILDASRKANPNVALVLLDPFVLPVTRLSDDVVWKRWNGECIKLRAIVANLAADYQAIHVKTQEVFDQACKYQPASHWIWDGVHPLPQGHELIARNWIKSVNQRYKHTDSGAQLTEKNARPRVLIIGDSISIQGYTKYAEETLKDKMLLHHHSGNAETTRNGIAKLDSWLAESGGNWDVIHFNWGLWDLRNQGTHVPLDQYTANLEKLVMRLKKTNARLIFATTTPVPTKNGFRRRDSDVRAYNAAAIAIMNREQIAIDDLYGFIKPTLGEHQLKNDVHFNQAGYKRLSQSVVRSLLSVRLNNLDNRTNPHPQK